MKGFDVPELLIPSVIDDDEPDVLDSDPSAVLGSQGILNSGPPSSS